MYPNIYYLLKDLFGVEFCLAQAIQTFGFFVALAFLTAAYFFGLELKRKEQLGLLHAKKIIHHLSEKSKGFSINNFIINSLLWALAGYKLSALLMDSCTYAQDIKSFIFSSQGNILGALLGGIYGYYSTAQEKKSWLLQSQEKEQWIRPHEMVGNMTFVAAIFGMLGAKIFHLLENPNEIPAMFESVDSFFSGLTIYGGILLGTIAVLYYSKKQGLSAIHVVDAGVPALLLAYGIGRLGCQFSGDGDWGIDNLAPLPQALSFLPEWLWSYTYPHNVLNAGVPIPACEGPFCHQLANPVYPTPLYESMLAFLGFAFLWAIRNRLKTAGLMTCIYLMINGLSRFWIEKIRVNETTSWFGVQITQAEIISTIFFIGGLVGLLVIFRKK